MRWTSTLVSGPARLTYVGTTAPHPSSRYAGQEWGAAGSFGSVVFGEVVGPVPGPVDAGDERDSGSGVEVFELAGSAVEPYRPGPGGEVKDDVSVRLVSVSGVENDLGVQAGVTGCFEVDDP